MQWIAASGLNHNGYLMLQLLKLTFLARVDFQRKHEFHKCRRNNELLGYLNDPLQNSETHLAKRKSFLLKLL